jgi:hypothetical protein
VYTRSLWPISRSYFHTKRVRQGLAKGDCDLFLKYRPWRRWLHSVTTICLHLLHFCRHLFSTLLPTSSLILSHLGRLRTYHLPRHFRAHL